MRVGDFRIFQPKVLNPGYYRQPYRRLKQKPVEPCEKAYNNNVTFNLLSVFVWENAKMTHDMRYTSGKMTRLLFHFLSCFIGI